MDEGEYEPGSRGKTLKNLLHLKTKREIDKAEWQALQSVQELLLDKYSKQHCFTVKDILKMHKLWLGKIYPWAGRYRNVNISKDHFHFAGSKYIVDLMKKFENNQLRQYTPCSFNKIDKIIEAIAVVHAELIIIHPFREGNGRLARLLANFMAMQADLPMLDYTHIAGKHRQDYIIAIHAAVVKNYAPMKEIFRIVIERSIKKISE